MKINIVLNIGKKPSGAARPIVEFANQLYKKHSVEIYKPFNPGREKGLECKLREWLGYFLIGKEYKQNWIECKPKIVIIPNCKERFIEKGDILFFRSPNLIEHIKKFSPSRGKKVMRVSNIFFALNPPDRISHDISLIASSSLIKSLLQKKYPDREIFVVVNGVNLQLFGFPSRKFVSPKNIGMVYYSGKHAQHKGMDNGFWVMERLKNRFPFLKFYLLGWEKEKKVPAFVIFNKGLNQRSVIEFYHKIDILIYPSKFDACPNPPMEAMASKCAVVTTNVGGISDYVIPGKTALVSEPGDKQTMLKNVISLIENPALWRTIANSGYEKIKEFSYEKQSEKLEKIMYEILKFH